MVRLTTLILLFVLLTSCSDSSEQPDWFQYQYEDGSPLAALTECGPTVASNALCWQTGKCLGRKAARAAYVTPAWWTMYLIKHYIVTNGGQAELRNFSAEDVAKQASGTAMIFHVNHTHFVTVFRQGHKVLRYDTNSGISQLTWDDFAKTVSYGKYITVKKL